MDEGHHRAHPYTYGGHSKRDYVAQDNAEMVELRARQRTFDGGYMRSMIMTLGSSIVFVRLFDERFYNSFSLHFFSNAFRLIVCSWNPLRLTRRNA